MKKLITIALLFLSVGVWAQVQRKHPNEIDSALVTAAKMGSTYKALTISSAYIEPYSYWFMGTQNTGRALFKIKSYQKLNQGVDSLRITVYKSQIKWLNDSTAIITPYNP